VIASFEAMWLENDLPRSKPFACTIKELQLTHPIVSNHSSKIHRKLIQFAVIFPSHDILLLNRAFFPEKVSTNS
jgi:hypothetical protein